MGFSFGFIVIQYISLLIPILICVAFSTLLERKILAAIQLRRGPNIVFWNGLFQPFADAIKLIFKEGILPFASNTGLFVAGPVIFLALALINWLILYVHTVVLSIDYNIFILLLCSAISVYGILLSGWASNSSYSFLGAVRSVAQLISYEISFALIIISLVTCWSSANMITGTFEQKYLYNIILFFPLFILFFVTILAETCRPPFDLPEAEAELVSGYNVEYSGLSFAFFFIGEYANMLAMSFFTLNLFLGGTVYHWVSNYILLFLIDCDDHFYYDPHFDVYKHGLDGNMCYLQGFEESRFMVTFYDRAYWVTITFLFANVIYLLTYVVSNRLHLYYEYHDIYDKVKGASFFSLITPIFFGFFCVEFFAFIRAIDHQRIAIPLDKFNDNFPFNPEYEETISRMNNVINAINWTTHEVVMLSKFLYSNYFLLNTLVLIIKVLLLFILFIWIRGAVPRYRYDQLMTLQWRKFLPLSLSLLIAYTGIFTLLYDPQYRLGGGTRGFFKNFLSILQSKLNQKF